MMKPLRILTALLLLAAIWYWQDSATQRGDVSLKHEAPAPASPAVRSPSAALPAFLPAEAARTLAAIARGGPHPYRQDGAVFQNRERRLPAQARGYYREFTVDTPGSSDRGARRIITGGDPPVAFWYTDDHYRSFRAFQVSR
jgi:ribonuclease T1